MKHLLILLLLTAIYPPLHAQDEYARGLYSYNLKPGDAVTVLADTAYVRSVPATGGTLVQSFTIGAKLVFLGDENVQTIRGFSAPWAHVRFTDKGVTQEGYIWRGLLALGSYERDGKRFLYGLDRAVPAAEKDMPPSLLAKVSVLDSLGAVVAVKKWALSSSEATNFSEGKVLGNMGLDGLTSIVRLCFSGEACAIPTDYYYFGWTGTALLPLPGKSDISDAGVFYHGEKLFFPSEKGGQPGKIVKVIEDEEYFEETDKDGNQKSKSTTSKESYRWDGKVAVKEK